MASNIETEDDIVEDSSQPQETMETTNAISRIKTRERWLGLQLKKMYNNILQEPVPEELQDLVNKLDNIEE